MSDIGITHSTVIVSDLASVTGITDGNIILINNVKIIGDGTTAKTTYSSSNNQVTISSIIPPNNAVKTVNAGTNITVNNTDPQNPIISTNSLQSIVAGGNITVNNIDPQNPIITAIIPPNNAVKTVNAGTNISVNNTDPQNPIISTNSLQSIVAGANISVNNTNPQNPIISAIIPANNAVKTVNAGTNITVNNTDPQNPIISASVPNSVLSLNGINGILSLVGIGNVIISQPTANTIAISSNAASSISNIISSDISLSVFNTGTVADLSYFGNVTLGVGQKGVSFPFRQPPLSFNGYFHSTYANNKNNFCNYIRNHYSSFSYTLTITQKIVMNWLNGGGQLNIQPRIEFAYGDGTTTILIPTSGNQFSVSENVEYTVTYIPYLLNNAKIPILNNIDFQIATNWSGDPDYYIMQVFTSKSMSFNFGGSFTFTE